MSYKSVYLSSTSLLPDREIDRPVVFLVEPYLTEPVKLRLEPIGYELLPKPWNDEHRLDEGYDYLENLYITFNERMGSVLSQIHRVDYPSSFLEIPMASWLLHFLHALFDRYSRLKKAVELYGKENIELFSYREDLKISKGFIDFIEATSFIEESASAFYGLVAKELGISVIEFNSTERHERNVFIQKKGIGTNFKLFYLKLFGSLKDKIFTPVPLRFFHGKDILISPHHFNRREQFIFAKKLEASFFIVENKTEKVLQQIDRTLLSSIAPRDEFEKIVISLLPRFMPMYLLEEFRSYEEQAKKWDSFKVYFAEKDWYTDILFCYAASLGRLKGARIVGSQHGGNYGQDKRSHTELIERKLNDFYITWGWRDSSYPGAQLLSLPQPNLSRCLNKHKPKTKTVLWSGTTTTKQAGRLTVNIQDKLFSYLECKRRFISYLDPKVVRCLVYRPHPVNSGWSDEEKEIFTKYPDVSIEHIGTLTELLQDVKLYICDNQGTSFMEALVINTPTILFWEHELYNERESAVPYFDLLRDAGILFHDPLKAAEQVNTVFDNVQHWWMGLRRQTARLKFMDRFCRADVNWQKEWIKAFRDIIETSKGG